MPTREENLEAALRTYRQETTTALASAEQRVEEDVRASLLRVVTEDRINLAAGSVKFSAAYNPEEADGKRVTFQIKVSLVPRPLNVKVRHGS